MNALNKSSELWHASVNGKARPVVEGEHDKSWNDHELFPLWASIVRVAMCGTYLVIIIMQIRCKKVYILNKSAYLQEIISVG